MNRSDKIVWMTRWANRHGMTLTLEGECGIGRECVGVLYGGNYPDYQDWSGNGLRSWSANFPDVWTPEDAYHKHPCVAVLGRGEAAEDQLYRWLKWFDDNNYRLETGTRDLSGKSQLEREIAILLNQHVYCRMVPNTTANKKDDTVKEQHFEKPVEGLENTKRLAKKKTAKKKTAKKRVSFPVKKTL